MQTCLTHGEVVASAMMGATFQSRHSGFREFCARTRSGTRRLSVTEACILDIAVLRERASHNILIDDADMIEVTLFAIAPWHVTDTTLCKAAHACAVGPVQAYGNLVRGWRTDDTLACKPRQGARHIWALRAQQGTEESEADNRNKHSVLHIYSSTVAPDAHIITTAAASSLVTRHVSAAAATPHI
eukprot:8148-Heterococcus_DN1.PRE.1